MVPDQRFGYEQVILVGALVDVMEIEGARPSSTPASFFRERLKATAEGNR
jgi:hypothetical protein